VIIGHYTAKSGWVNDAVLARTIDAGVDYTLGVSLKGSTVSVTLNAQAAVGFAYNAVTVDGDFGLLATAGAASFDDVKVKTSDRAFAQASGAAMEAAAPMLMTDNASTLTQGELDAAAMAAMSAWTEALGNGDPRLGGFGDVRITTADLTSEELGYTQGAHVWIDANAAGYGWSSHGGTMDLVTVVTHELGHILGFDHGDAKLYPVMTDNLQPGLSHLIEAARVDGHDGDTLSDAALMKLAKKAVELNFDLDALGGGRADARVDWQPSTNVAWTTAYSPFAVPDGSRSTNFSDYLVKPTAAADGSDYDSLGKTVLGKKKPK